MTRLKKTGFTLVELLLYMGLLSIFLVVLTDLYLSVLNVQTESQATSAVEQDGRYILGKFMYDIPQVQSSTAIVSPTLGVSSSTLQLTIGAVSYVYSLNGGNLQLVRSDLGTEILNGYDTTISNLNFTHLGNSGAPNTAAKDTVSVSFTVTSKTKKESGVEQRPFQTTIAIR